MFNFEQTNENENDLTTVAHLIEQATELGVETGYNVAMLEGQTAEQLNSIAAEIQTEIEAEIAKLEAEKLPACHIGPYAGGRCQICGLRDPN